MEGSEQGGARPVLIISNNLMNVSAPIVIAVPITRAGEKVRLGPFNVQFKMSGVVTDKVSIEELTEKGCKFAGVDGAILCNHARSISKERLIGRVGYFKDYTVIEEVIEAIKHSFNIDGCDDCGIPLRPEGLLCVRCKRVYRIKCVNCGSIISVRHKYCSNCGREI